MVSKVRFQPNNTLPGVQKSKTTDDGVLARIRGCSQLPRISFTEDPRRNCEKFIQTFKDWCELNEWYDSEPPAEETAEEADRAS